MKGTPDKFKVCLVQMSMTDDPEANLAKAVARIREAAQQGAALVCLPELFRAQYFCQYGSSTIARSTVSRSTGLSTEKQGMLG